MIYSWHTQNPPGWSGWGEADYYSHTYSVVISSDINVTNWISNEGHGACVGFETAGGVVWTYENGIGVLEPYTINNYYVASEGIPPNGYNAWGNRIWFSQGYGGGVLSTNYVFSSSEPGPFTLTRIDEVEPDDYPYHISVNVYSSPVVLTVTRYAPPPDTNYYCYFDLEGVAMFGSATNKYFTATLWIQKNGDLIQNVYGQTVSANGAFTLTYGPWLWDRAAYPAPNHWWTISIGGQLDNQLNGPAMSAGNENNYHYITTFDFMEYDTNSPYIPSDPNDTNNPPENPYVEMPPSWDTNLYGPYPPYYSPWPPSYDAPPPLTEWPSSPPPNWTYNPNSPYSPDYPGPPSPTNDPSNPTNYPGDSGGSTNIISYTLAEWYNMFRDALRDSGNEYVSSDPAQYGLSYSNDLLVKASLYTSNFFAAGYAVQSNTDALYIKGNSVLSNLALALPTTLAMKDSFTYTFPMLDEPIVMTVADWPVIAVFRSLCKWVMYLMSFWIAFRMIRRTLGRVSD